MFGCKTSKHVWTGYLLDCMLLHATTACKLPRQSYDIHRFTCRFWYSIQTCLGSKTRINTHHQHVYVIVGVLRGSTKYVFIRCSALKSVEAALFLCQGDVLSGFYS